MDYQEVLDDVGDLQIDETSSVLNPPKPTRGGVIKKRGRRRKSNILRITRKRRPKKKYEPQPEVQQLEETVDNPKEPPDFTNLMILADAAVMRLAEIQALKTSEAQQNSGETTINMISDPGPSTSPPPKKRRRGRKSKDEVLRIDTPSYYE